MMTKKPSKLYPEGYDNVPDVVKEENFDDAIPIGGGHGAGGGVRGAAVQTVDRRRRRRLGRVLGHGVPWGGGSMGRWGGGSVG